MLTPNSNPAREAKLSLKAREIIDNFTDDPETVKKAKDALFYSFTTALQYHQFPEIMHDYVENIMDIYYFLTQVEKYQEELEKPLNK